MKEIAPTSKSANQYAPISSISVQELRVGMMHAARLVRRYGMTYWPNVERLQREIHQIEAREALLDQLLKSDLTGEDRADFG